MDKLLSTKLKIYAHEKTRKWWCVGINVCHAHLRTRSFVSFWIFFESGLTLSPGCPGTHYVGQGGLESTVMLLPLHPASWDYRHDHHAWLGHEFFYLTCKNYKHKKKDGQMTWMSTTRKQVESQRDRSPSWSSGPPCVRAELRSYNELEWQPGQRGTETDLTWKDAFHSVPDTNGSVTQHGFSQWDVSSVSGIKETS